MTRIWIPVLFLALTGCEEFLDDTGAPTDSGLTTQQVDCGEPLVQPEDIDVATTWSCTVQISGDYRIRNVLTLEPCTRVELDGRVFVEDGGRIEARGTADCPVTFTSLKASPGPGDWTYIDYDPTADNGNEFEHTIFEYGGNEHGLFTGNGEVEVAFRNITVRHTEALGLDLREFDVVELTQAHFEDVPAHPVEIHGTDVGAITEVTVTDVQEPRILVSQGGGRTTLGTDDTWYPQEIPYELTGELRFDADYTMEAGVHLTAPAGARYFIDDGGTLSLNGTAENPVILESVADSPLPGDWSVVNFQGGSDSGSTWTHAIVRHGGGSGSGAVYLHPDAVLDLDNVSFQDNLDCDINDQGTVNAVDSPYVSCN